MGFVILSKSKPGDPHLDTILTSEIHLLETFGVESGMQLLPVWRHPDDQAIGVYDSSGQLLAGSPRIAPGV